MEAASGDTRSATCPSSGALVELRRVVGLLGGEAETIASSMSRGVEFNRRPPRRPVAQLSGERSLVVPAAELAPVPSLLLLREAIFARLRTESMAVWSAYFSPRTILTGAQVPLRTSCDEDGALPMCQWSKKYRSMHPVPQDVNLLTCYSTGVVYGFTRICFV